MNNYKQLVYESLCKVRDELQDTIDDYNQTVNANFIGELIALQNEVVRRKDDDYTIFKPFLDEACVREKQLRENIEKQTQYLNHSVRILDTELAISEINGIIQRYE